MAITGGFGLTVDIEKGVVRRWVIGLDGQKRWADTGLPFTHKSTGRLEGDEDSTVWVCCGPACGEKQSTFSSSCWSAVDCPDCLQLKVPKGE